MHGQPARIAGRILAAVIVGGTAVAAAASPGHAATITAAQAAAAKAKYIEASGYTGKEVHATWAGPASGPSPGPWARISWPPRPTPTGPAAPTGPGGRRRLLELRVPRHRALVVSNAANWPGDPAFGGEYRAQVYTPGNVDVVQGDIESWISNGGVPYTDPSGSGDTITLKQFRRC